MASLTRLLVVGSVAITLAGCSGGSTSGTSGRFEQTWPKSYANTTCADWNDDMTSDQQRVAAADMLTNTRDVDGIKPALPDDALIADFQQEVTTACSARAASKMAITEVAVGVYILDKPNWHK